ncbi:MAG: hypothetical protein LBE37_08775 [Sphingobacterium sp.]|jgi:hypothetical protein|nr:hypothetical protein [Sphingobacterium sp.]
MLSALQTVAVDTLGVAGSTPTYTYWKPGYYDSIPTSKMIIADTLPSYDAMLSRYQSKEFEYIESISDKLSFFDKLFDRIGTFFSSLFPAPNTNFNEGILNILAVVGGVIFVFLAYKFFISRKRVYIHHEHEEEEMQQIDFVEKNLLRVDVDAYLSEALQQKNYALAVRYLHLMNIQLLGRKGIVQWNQSKTNSELMEEVDNVALKNEFLACAALFDYVWFGGFVITAASYAKYEEQFVQFQRRWS